MIFMSIFFQNHYSNLLLTYLYTGVFVVNFKINRCILLSAIFVISLPMLGAEDNQRCEQKSRIAGVATILTTATVFSLYTGGNLILNWSCQMQQTKVCNDVPNFNDWSCLLASSVVLGASIGELKNQLKFNAKK